VALEGEMRNTYIKFQSKNLKGRDHLGLLARWKGNIKFDLKEIG
jgi:hypothetical protein